MKNVLIISCVIFLFAACSPKNQAILNLPVCLANKIDSIRKDGKINMPQSVIRYTYKGESVYYVTSGCCDQFNEVYDNSCKSPGAPDGGVTGKGDGRLPEFFTNATNKRVVWENK